MSEGKNTSRLRIPVALDLTEARRVGDEVESFAERHGLGQEVIFKLRLSLDELLTNIVSYGFDEEGAADPRITVELTIDDSTLQTIISDNGMAFNPLEEAPPPALIEEAEDRPLGGLGIHLTKTFMDSLSYERVQDLNRLTLSQSLYSVTQTEP